MAEPAQDQVGGRHHQKLERDLPGVAAREFCRNVAKTGAGQDLVR